MSKDEPLQSNLGSEISKMNLQWVSLYRDLVKCGVVKPKSSSLSYRNNKTSERRSRKRKHSHITITLSNPPRKNNEAFYSFLNTRGWQALTNTNFEASIFELWEQGKFVEDNPQKRSQRHNPSHRPILPIQQKV